MSTAPEVTSTPIRDLDPAVVGRMLMNLPVISVHAGHKGIRATLGYGAGTPGRGEMEHNFVRDVLTRPVAEVIEKWYGGKTGVMEIQRELATGAAARVPRTRPRST